MAILTTEMPYKQKHRQADAITRPIVVKFWNPTLGIWVRLTLKCKKRAYSHPFSLSYEGYKTVPRKTKPYRIQPPNEYRTLWDALGAIQSYIHNWSTE